MQRAAASASNRTPLKPSPLPASNPSHLSQQPAERQKPNAFEPQSPGINISIPRSFSGMDDPATPLMQQSARSSTANNYGGNEAESPWVLNTARGRDVGVIQDSPIEDAWLQDTIIGRRTFGNFQKKSTKKAPISSKGGDDDGSLSAGSLDEDLEQYGERMHGATTQNSRKPKGKRPNEQDGERMDKINLKKLKIDSLSASSGLREAGLGGKKNSKGRRKG
jgi:hypothetical protein